MKKKGEGWWNALDQRCSKENDFAPRGYLAIVRDIFDFPQHSGKKGEDATGF